MNPVSVTTWPAGPARGRTPEVIDWVQPLLVAAAVSRKKVASKRSFGATDVLANRMVIINQHDLRTHCWTASCRKKF